MLPERRSIGLLLLLLLLLLELPRHVHVTVFLLVGFRDFFVDLFLLSSAQFMIDPEYDNVMGCISERLEEDSFA